MSSALTNSAPQLDWQCPITGMDVNVIRKPSTVKDKNIKALSLRPITKRGASLEGDALDTPKTPREMIREMSHPMVIFGSSPPAAVTPTVLVSYSLDEGPILDTPGLSTDGSTEGRNGGYESDDYSWDFKCRGEDDSREDFVSTFDILCDLNKDVPKLATTTSRRPDVAIHPTTSDENDRLSMILEDMEHHLTSRHIGVEKTDVPEKGLPATFGVMPILCQNEDPLPLAPARRPLSIVSNCSACSAQDTSQPPPRSRTHVRSTSLSKGENSSNSSSLAGGARSRSSTVRTKKHVRASSTRDTGLQANTSVKLYR